MNFVVFNHFSYIHNDDNRKAEESIHLQDGNLGSSIDLVSVKISNKEKFNLFGDYQEGDFESIELPKYYWSAIYELHFLIDKQQKSYTDVEFLLSSKRTPNVYSRFDCNAKYWKLRILKWKKKEFIEKFQDLKDDDKLHERPDKLHKRFDRYIGKLKELKKWNMNHYGLLAIFLCICQSTKTIGYYEANCMIPLENRIFQN